MEDAFLNETHWVTDPEAAQILTDLGELRSLLPFFFKEITLTEAASALGLKLNTMHYRAQRFIDLGLLEVIREEPRKGRAVKVYRATSSEYFVPFEATSAETVEKLFTQLRAKISELFEQNVARSLLEVEDIGLRIKAQGKKLSVDFDTPDGSFALRDTETLDLPAVFTSDNIIRLDFSRAKELQKELVALLKKYTDEEPTGQDYLLVLGLTPLHESLLNEDE